MAGQGGELTIRVIDLMLFHTTERNLYARLTQRLGQEPEEMHAVMALWLWLESIGHHDFIRHVYSYNDEVILRFVAEATACMQAVVLGGVKDDNLELPFMARLVSDPIDLRFFLFNREVATRGINRILTNVCRIIFDDELMRQAAGDMDHPANKSVIMNSGLVIESSSPSGSSIAAAGGGGLFPPPAELTTVLDQGPFTPIGRELIMVPPPLTSVVPAAPPLPLMPLSQAASSMLNPMARPYNPGAPGQAPEDQRSMFITFSKGHPISREDIMDFFNAYVSNSNQANTNWRYGPCVETVMIEKAPGGKRPMYGRVVFTSASMITAVLNGQRTAKFMIKGKHLWARMYVPRQN